MSSKTTEKPLRYVAQSLGIDSYEKKLEKLTDFLCFGGLVCVEARQSWQCSFLCLFNWAAATVQMELHRKLLGPHHHRSGTDLLSSHLSTPPRPYSIPPTPAFLPNSSSYPRFLLKSQTKRVISP
ncbi:uncharacterized protein CLUP02_12229 [Colletotrichum lupini]|uniref:Uncharacterized protein n=1 Tax=Colletotrichum lupini TaxID=145971 RepID=A0A9Q8T063_9PEZI|nr:uncharacterized protein CLUP02_12229 [Colletotrichum lupini]UQC86727.1 hypothetical protein CLUP02_12229 [Colletotrichum lupini]